MPFLLPFAAGYVFVPSVHFVVVVAFAVVDEADLLDGVFELAEEDATSWPFLSFLAGEDGRDVDDDVDDY